MSPTRSEASAADERPTAATTGRGTCSITPRSCCIRATERYYHVAHLVFTGYKQQSESLKKVFSGPIRIRAPTGQAETLFAQRSASASPARPDPAVRTIGSAGVR